MIKTILAIQGMSCSMCEAHVNDTIRRAFNVKKVSSSCKKNQTEIISDYPLDEQKLRDAMQPTGYTIVTISSEPYEKRGFWK